MLKFNATIRKLRRQITLRRTAITLAALASGLCFASGEIFAQSDSLGQIQSVLQGISSGNNPLDSSGGVGQTNLPPSTVLQPTLVSNAQLPPSRLEQIMSSRAGVTMYQFGYDQLGVGQTVTVPQAGAVQDNYILGSGDEIVISLRGQDDSQYRVQVDRNGQVVVPRIAPILAAGRTLGDFRQDVMNAVHKAYISTQAFVSLGQLRQISVLVTGDVNAPGMRLVTGLSTPMDAILLSGGVKKTGSLRNVKIVHGNTETTVDLYGILTQRGVAQQVLLSDGDRIVVPPLGPTVAAAGWFRRPGIYELPAGAKSISVHSLVALAGGLEVRGRYRLSELHTEPSGTNALIGLKSEIGTIRDGDLLFAIPGADQTVQNATLSGGTALAGQYAVGKAAQLSEILKAPGALGPTPYTLLGIIVRRDPITKFVSLIPFSPAAILESRQDMAVASNDIVRVFTQDEALLLSADVEKFETDRAQVDENLHSPIDALQSQSKNSSGPVQNTQMPNQATDSSISERTIIAGISAKTLGEGGVLSDRLPTNEYPPFGLTPDQTTYLANAAPPNSATMYSQSPNNQASSGVQNAIGMSPFANANSSLTGGNGSLSGANSSLTGGNLTGPASSLTAFAASQNRAQTNPLSQFGSVSGASTQQTVNQIQPSAALPTAYPQASAPNFQDAQSTVSDFPLNERVETFGQLVRQLHIDPVVLMHFLDDRRVSVSGTALGAGLYLIGPQTTVHDLIAASGGTSEWTDVSRVELISTSILPGQESASTAHRIVALTDPSSAQYELHPRDELRLNDIDTKIGAGAVTVQGQVRYSGTYNIERGERLSELLLRAGGLTDVAYPYGTVFLRQSAASAERQAYRREATELQNIIASGLSRIGQDKISPDAFTALDTFAEELKTAQALGRISVVADPAMLAADPSRDPLLEPGDVIFIPQRPSTVSVLGQVNQPGTFLFSANATVDDYIRHAGGYNALSDKSLTFVVLPDGTARPVDSSWLSFNSEDIPPGSTIVVQRDVAPLDTRQLILDLAGIFQSLAVSAASLAVLHNN